MTSLVQLLTVIFAIADKELLPEVRESVAKNCLILTLKKVLASQNCQSNTKIQILLISHHS